MKKFFRNIWRYKALIIMALPGAIWMIFFFYIPVFANVVAFKDFHIDPDGFLASLTNSPWVGFKNFQFFFKSADFWIVLRNTVGYNLAFLALNFFFAIFNGIVMSQLRNRRTLKVYQTAMLFPYFLSLIYAGASIIFLHDFFLVKLFSLLASYCRTMYNIIVALRRLHHHDCLPSDDGRNLCLSPVLLAPASPHGRI